MIDPKNTNPEDKAAASSSSAPNIKSPYYLHPSDHPGLQICPVTLQGDANYDEWSTSMLNSLTARRKLGFLTERIKKPDDDEDLLEDWAMVNSMLIGWIIQSIDPSLRSSITYFSTVKELWDDLQQRFSVGNGPRKLQLRHIIASSKQEGHSVATYFGSLKKLWDELAGYVSLPSCTEPNCSVKPVIIKEREEERIHQFLIGLTNDTYGQLRSSVLAQDPVPPIALIYSLDVQQERLQTVVTNRSSADNPGFSAQQTPSPSTQQPKGNSYEDGDWRG